jgi:hypothetical protein
MSTATSTAIHVIISLVALASEFVVIFGLLRGKKFDGWTATFLATMILTDLTGYCFRTTHLLPSQIIGTISLLVLAVAIVARYRVHLAGRARITYVIAAVVALYPDSFVAVVQAFLKIPLLRALAPTQSDPPFAIAQGLLLIGFVFSRHWGSKAISNRADADRGCGLRIIAEINPLQNQPPNLTEKQKKESIYGEDHHKGWHADSLRGLG